MKYILWAFITVLLYAGCNKDSKNNPGQEQPTKINMVGNDADEHGCKGSTGSTWSVVKNECIRVFEDGKRLNAAVSGMDATLSAFAVFKTSPQDSLAEVFIPWRNGGILLARKENNSWANDSLTLTLLQNKFVLQSTSGWKYTE